MPSHDLRALMSRPPDWSAPDGEAAFWMFAEMTAGSLWIGRFRGSSPWERHPEGDELLHQLEGEVEVTLLLPGGESTQRLRAGGVLVVPRGVWHRQVAATESLQYGLTPMPTEHSEAADPRAGG